MTNRAPSVSVVILAKDEIRHLRRSLPTLLRQDAAHPFEVIVVDSGSTDGTLGFVEAEAARDPRIRVVRIPPEEFHHARTRNLGASLALGRYLVFLGGDAVPVGTGWLTAIVEPIVSGTDQSVVAVYGRQMPRANARAETVCRMHYNYGSVPRVNGANLAATQKDRFFFSSVNCCIDLARVTRPLFDERFPVAEDITLSKRIIDAGLRTAYQPRAVVEHSHDYTRIEVLRRYFDHAIVYQRLGILGGDPSAVAGDGRRYLVSSIGVLKGRGARAWLQFAAYLSCSVVGLQLGIHHHWLPKRVRRALTVYGLN